MAKAIRKTEMPRPEPPVDLRSIGESFAPAHDLVRWIVATFIEETGTLTNPEHSHLDVSTIGALWTNAPMSRGGRPVVGLAEMPVNMQGNKWAVERQKQQLREWFGAEPDFLLTFFAPVVAELPDADFCALVEHELYHCGHKRDENDVPMFRRDGSPKLFLRGHDVEEFTGVVKRYGVGAASDGVAEMVEAAKQLPEMRRSDIGRACGTCALRLA